MKGRNELHLNAATMFQVVQEYIDMHYPEMNSIVFNVRQEHDSFVVILDAKKEKV